MFFLFSFLLALLPFSFTLATPRHLASRALDRVEKSQFLGVHNIERMSHGADPFQWSDDLASKADSWASRCQLKGSDGSLSGIQYGENIVAATGDFSINAAVGTFLSDKDQYNSANPVYNHWTQAVWKSSKEVGCAVSECDGIFDAVYGTAKLVVCLYSPAGNIVGQALDNVQP
uniref:Pathogenesis-related protein 1 n=1 Tax=Moniliophthora perniciosa TaxID=153609 RepID=A0A8E6Y7M3_MONPR|nr:pathogenesis-related protein 1 [Moniliophthora perniciosa]QVT77386.1 pathogenesis-related protein 1 [Moniliophthora perniciosa]QVT77392.1 pathogenesis-related protein 1 [Moniliophthora perniciosa]QVT77393.1 pathogenesis-related protein 1 [Moniliophthora perniciosa]QVT77397.1 pathogenesis-related protein 1 [Moniliophthora perniciosa]